MKPKITDVAKLAGVSPTTVSRVLNNRGYISDQTRTKVYDAMKEINYTPNELARSLYTKRSNIIGLIIPTTSNPYFGELAFYIENFCADLGFKVLICNSLNRVDKEKEYWEMLLRNQVDGVIVGTHNRGVIDSEEHHPPVIAIDQYISKHFPVVESDNYRGGELATYHLLQKGCEQIIHLNGPRELDTPANYRRKAYEHVMNEMGKEPITYEIKNVFSKENQVKVIQKLLSDIPDVDGVFASDDLIAATLMRETQKIDKKIEIVGYDGTETTRLLLPNLTTIRQPIKEIAETSVNALIEIIEHGELKSYPFETKLPVKLIEGK